MPTDPQPTTSAAAQNQNNDSHVTQSFRDQKNIETFIRGSKLLKTVEDATDHYVSTYQQSKRPEDALAALIVPLHFTYADLLDPFVELLQLAVEEPLQFAEAAKYCVYALIRDLVKQSSAESGLKGSIDIDQVHIQLRFVGLPLQQDLLFEPSRNYYRTGLSLVLGILSALTEPEKTVIQSVWFCGTGCTRNKIQSEQIDAPMCSECSRQMSEYSKLRTTQNCCLLRLLPVDSVQTPRVVNKVIRAITVRVRDHTHNCKLRLGSRYLITGYYDYGSKAPEFQAWNLIKH